MSADGSERDRRASQPQITKTFHPEQGDRESVIAGETAKSDSDFDLRGTVCITCGAILDPAYESTQATCPRCRPTRAPVPAPAPRVANQATHALDNDGDARATVRSKREERLPTHVARFSILGELGTGGYGRVYRAYDPNMSQEVALKVPRREKFSSEREYHDYLEEFRSEGAKLSRLIHPGIVRVYECGDFDDGNGAYISMELMEGGSLSRHQSPERRLTPLQVARILSRVAEALHFAHLTGFLHRDIKPANILLDKDGRPKLSDFGLAIEEDDQLWRRGLREGTLSYMAPEQVAARVPHMDGRADIWSLGVILYVLLAGRLPFEGVDQDDLCDAIANKPFRPLSQRDSKIPAVFDEILGRCLSKTVEGRYVTALELSNALRTIERRANLKLLLAVGGGVAGVGAAVALAMSFRKSHEIDEDPIEVAAGTGRWIALPLRPPLQLHPESPSSLIDYDIRNGVLSFSNATLTLASLGRLMTGNWSFETELSIEDGARPSAGVFFGYRPVAGNANVVRYQWCGIVYRGDPVQRFLTRTVCELAPTNVAGTWAEAEISAATPTLLTGDLASAKRLKLQINISGGFVTRILLGDRNFDKELVHPVRKPLDLAWPPAVGHIGVSGCFGQVHFHGSRVFVSAK